MNCTEFQDELCEFIDSGNAAGLEHARSCPECAALAEDLRAVAKSARQLATEAEPPAYLWGKIEAAAVREGLVRPAEDFPRVKPFMVPAFSGGMMRWGAVMGALIVGLALASYNYLSPSASAPATVAATDKAAPVTEALDAADQQLLAQISAEHGPAARRAYERNIRNVNTYIHEAQAAQRQNPGDNDLRLHLESAYEQKAALYQMASYTP